MNPKPAFEDDVSALPTHGFGTHSLTWWGVIGFMVIEGTAFALVIAAYFFIMAQEHEWAPREWQPPGLIAGTLFLIVILLSEIPNTLLKQAAEAYDLEKVRALLPVMAGVGVPLLILRVFEFNSLHVFWFDSAYGSIIWALLVLHTTHIGTDFFDTIVLWLLMRTPHGEVPRRFVDTSENALYWRFVWLTWIPIYVLIYWVPRMFR